MTDRELKKLCGCWTCTMFGSLDAEDVAMGEENGQRTPGGKIMSGAGRDGQHRSDPSSRAVGDNGMRTRTPAGIEVGQKSGHDIQDEVRPPARDADTSTEDHDGDLDDAKY